MLKLCAMKMRKEDNSLVGVGLKERGRTDLLEIKCAPLVGKSNALRGDNENLKLEPFKEDLSESRKGVKSFEKAKAMLESLKNNLTECKNLIEKATCGNEQFEIEHASLVENFGNSGIGCKSSKTNLTYKKGQLAGNHPSLIKEKNAFVEENGNTKLEELKNERKLEFRNRVLKLLRGKHLSKLNEQKVVVKEDGKILKNKFEVKGKDLLRDLTNDRYDLEEIINRGDGSMFEYKELDSRGREYLLRFERLKLQIDKHEGTVIDRGKTGNNDVRLENKNSNMVLNLRNRDCVTFLTTRLCDDHESGLKWLMDQRGHKQRGMSVKKQVHLDRDLEELLEQSDNFFVKQHEKVWSRRSGCMDQVIVIQEVIQTGLSSTGVDMDGNNFQDDQKVEFDQDLEKRLEQKAPRNVRMEGFFLSILYGVLGLASVHDSNINDEGRSDDFSVRHQEKGWLRMLRYLDREATVQEIKQAGLSSISM